MPFVASGPDVDVVVDVVGRRRDLVGWWAPVLKDVRWRRIWPWRDFGSGYLDQHAWKREYSKGIPGMVYVRSGSNCRIWMCPSASLATM